MEALAKHVDKVAHNYGVRADERLWFCPICDASPDEAVKMETLPQLLERVQTWMAEA